MNFFKFSKHFYPLENVLGKNDSHVHFEKSAKNKNTV